MYVCFTDCCLWEYHWELEQHNRNPTNKYTQVIVQSTCHLLMYTTANPSQFDAHVSDVSPTHITFTWNPVASDCSDVQYRLYTSNCGVCPIATVHTSVSCSHPIVDGRVCEFYAQSVVCGNITGNISNLATLTLKGKYSCRPSSIVSILTITNIVPQVQDVNILPQYSRKRNDFSDSLTSITMNFSSDSVS